MYSYAMCVCTIAAYVIYVHGMIQFFVFFFFNRFGFWFWFFLLGMRGWDICLMNRKVSCYLSPRSPAQSCARSLRSIAISIRMLSSPWPAPSAIVCSRVAMIRSMLFIWQQYEQKTSSQTLLWLMKKPRNSLIHSYCDEKNDGWYDDSLFSFFSCLTSYIYIYRKSHSLN